MNAELINTEWHVWHKRKRSPLMIYFFFYGAHTQHVEGLPYLVGTTGSCNEFIVMKKEELSKLSEEIWNKLKIDPNFVSSEIKKALAQHKNDLKKWRSYLERDFNSLSNKELEMLYTEYVNSVLRYGKYTYFPLAIENNLSDEIRRIVSKEEYDIVMTPISESEMVNARKSLLKIMIKNEDLETHKEKFSFLKRKGMLMEFFDEDHYREEMKKCVKPQEELQQLEKETKRKQDDFENVLKKYSGDPWVYSLLKTANLSIFFRNWRTEHIIQSSYYVVPMFKEIAKRLDLNSYKDVLYLLPDEVKALLEKVETDPNEVVALRREAFVFLTQESGTIILDGNEAINFQRSLNLSKKITDTIKGTSAFRGKVQGEVYIFEGHHGYQEIKNAEILVAHTTVPEMVPYLGNIKAIVTEEGGILSHAAVISREFKIPSVIGTGNATKVLQDGDLVEVDAEQGIVRKIK
jgi:phosphohistidine swiveling domain-containing protein